MVGILGGLEIPFDLFLGGLKPTFISKTHSAHPIITSVILIDFLHIIGAKPGPIFGSKHVAHNNFKPN